MLAACSLLVPDRKMQVRYGKVTVRVVPQSQISDLVLYFVVRTRLISSEIFSPIPEIDISSSFGAKKTCSTV